MRAGLPPLIKILCRHLRHQTNLLTRAKLIRKRRQQFTVITNHFQRQDLSNHLGAFKMNVLLENFIEGKTKACKEKNQIATLESYQTSEK